MIRPGWNRGLTYNIEGGHAVNIHSAGGPTDWAAVFTVVGTVIVLCLLYKLYKAYANNPDILPQIIAGFVTLLVVCLIAGHAARVDFNMEKQLDDDAAWIAADTYHTDRPDYQMLWVIERKIKSGEVVVSPTMRQDSIPSDEEWEAEHKELELCRSRYKAEHVDEFYDQSDYYCGLTENRWPLTRTGEVVQ